MKTLLISFSGRKEPGNCSKILDYLNSFLTEKNADVTKLEMVNLQISPCFGCKYECFDTILSCPMEDDLQEVYAKIMDSDLVIMAIPVYSAAPPAIYFAWRERSQGIFKTYEAYEAYKKVKKGYIIIGNEDAGGRDAIDLISKEDNNIKEGENLLLLQNHKYGLNSIKGELLKKSEVKLDLQKFLLKLLASL